MGPLCMMEAGWKAVGCCAIVDSAWWCIGISIFLSSSSITTCRDFSTAAIIKDVITLCCVVHIRLAEVLAAVWVTGKTVSHVPKLLAAPLALKFFIAPLSLPMFQLWNQGWQGDLFTLMRQGRWYWNPNTTGGCISVSLVKYFNHLLNLNQF